MRNWFLDRLTYHKFQLIYSKLKLIYYWRNLDLRSKLLILTSAGGLFATILYYGHQHLKIVAQDYENFIKEDLSESKALCKRRKKGIPPGLFNEGNTCFGNSVLQAISSCQAFTAWLKELDANNNANVTVLPALLRIVRALNNESGNQDSYSLSDLFESLRCHGWVISAEQQDAFELYNIIMTALSEEFHKVKLTHHYDLLDDSTKKISNDKRKVGSLGENCISPFDLSFASKMTCLTCNFQNPIKFDKGSGIVLDIHGVNQFGKVTLHSSLRKLIAPELVYEVDCDNCSKKSKLVKKSTFSKQVLFAKLPQCLCIQLQRTFYTNSGFVMKNPVHVSFPEVLDMGEYTFVANLMKRKKSNDSKNDSKDLNTAKLLGGNSALNVRHAQVVKMRKKYHLRSVVAHYGYADDGHYVTYRLHQDQWIFASDENVHAVDINRVLKANAYLLFYEKQV